MYYIDERNGQTKKSFEGDFADNTTAVAARAQLVNALQGATGAAIYQADLTAITVYANNPVAGYRVTDRMSATVYLDQSSSKKANFQVPAPLNDMLTGGTLIKNAPEWTDVIDTIKSGGSGWTISDGEFVDDTGGKGTVKGRLISVRSGDETLPA